MGGKWLYRKSLDHICAKPNSGNIQTGDIWQCDCGVMWKAKRESDMRESWTSWSVHTGPVPAQKTTGYAVNDLSSPGPGPFPR